MLWTRLVLKESELRENWERLYWDEEYSKKLGEDRANYLSLEDEDEDFSPYMNRPFDFDQLKWFMCCFVLDSFSYLCHFVYIYDTNA
ncbi:hypothetical protein UlMin_027557 [Ulmus minor]